MPVNSTSVLPKSVSIQKYKMAITLVKDAWLSLDIRRPSDRVASTEEESVRSHLRQALVAMYLAEHKSATAEWIESLDDIGLSAAIEEHRRFGDSDFTPTRQIKYALASVYPNGTLFVSKGGCTGFSIVPTSPNYLAFKKLVGPIEPGYVKEISPIPEDLLTAENLYQRSKN